MMLKPPSLLKNSSLLSLFFTLAPPHPHSLSPFKTPPITSHHLSTTALATPPPPDASSSSSSRLSRAARSRRNSPETQLRYQLDLCSKHGDLPSALRLYDLARSQRLPLSVHHFNTLLYLCAHFFHSRISSSTLPAIELSPESALDRGFEIFRHMESDAVAPNEATFTNLARLASARRDPHLAFDLVKKMHGCGIPPRLRSYGPALFGFCDVGEAEQAYEVDAHMAQAGVAAEEPELAALLRASAGARSGDKVYEMLHRLRARARRVLASTAGVVEGWFGSDAAEQVGEAEWDAEKVREGVVRGGGGWHGLGWLGKGKWRVVRSRVNESGVCGSCGEKLVCIDIDPLETENFAKSLSTLASQREVRANFNTFQEWLSCHGPFEAVIDGANVGISNLKHFSFSQLNNVVKGVQHMGPSRKMPLIVLHSGRVWGGPARDPINKKILDSWRRLGVLYTTPTGSNDDWYWLYAAVSCNCLLITNDEMRDHLFQLLGTNFFPRWKEKHQVRLTFSKHGPIFHMPPPYSVVIQESEAGSWHVPIVSHDEIETSRVWICATRNPSLSAQAQLHVDPGKKACALG